jgi:phosphoglycolate phosphatase
MTAAPPAIARAALFDLDGTLLDTAVDMATALNTLRQQRALPPLEFAAIRCEVSHGSNAVVRAGFPQAQEAEFEALRAQFLRIYRGCLADQTALFDGFAATLAVIEEAGVPWGVVTNKPGWLVDPLLEATGLAQRAGCVVAGDSLPERKPHPRPLLVAAGLLEVAPAHCLYLGDAQRDIDAARAAGMIALGASFGYLRATDQPHSWQAAAWLNHPLELLPWLGLAPSNLAIASHG